MRRKVATIVTAITTLGTAAVLAAPASAERPDPRVVSHGMSGVVPARASAHGGHKSSPDLINHGGPVMTSTFVQPIFWGTSWTNSSFVGDKFTGIDSFYKGVGGSSYLKTNSEYSGSNGAVGTGVTSATHLLDTSAAPSNAPQTSQILAEVAKKITNPVANGYYPVYVDTPRGHAGYCAWHSWGSINDVPVQFAFFFNLDADPGCDPGDSVTGHSQGLAALANVSGHELSETLTDARGSAWYDASGNENADKCAWTFNGTVSFGNTQWLIQGNWSNAAYDHGQTGYANGGCIV